MDTIAHMLWATLGARVAARRCAVAPAAVVATTALAGLPDVVHLLPVATSVLAGATPPAALIDYALAVPGQEPALPVWATLAAHHLHCTFHSALIATLVTWLVLRRYGAVWFPLYGWWSHIVIDVFSHSKAYYPAPIAYPLSYWGFDGIAWNQPWFLAMNYSALALAYGIFLAARWCSSKGG